MSEETQEREKVAFIDHVGRTIVGEVAAEDDEILSIDNPVILHWQVREDKSIEVQTFTILHGIH